MVDRLSRIARRAAGIAGRPLGAGVLAAALALAVIAFGPPGGDQAAHLYLTQAWRDHGWQLWDNFWYSGRYAQVNYSLLFYPLAALAGLTTVVVASCGAAAAAFAALVRRRWPALATGPAVAFALLVPLGVVAGTYPFLLGLAIALGSAAGPGRRSPGAGAGGRGGDGARPPAGAGLPAGRPGRRGGVDAGVVALARQRGARAGRGPGRRGPGRCCCAASAPTAPTTRSTPRTRSRSPAFCAVGLALCAGPARPAPRAGPLRGLRDPRRGGVRRLLAARRQRRPPDPADGRAAAAAARWPPGASGRAASRSPASRRSCCGRRCPRWPAGAPPPSRAPRTRSFWYPVIAFLEHALRPDHRVQVVATADNWEAFYLARRGVPLARGWFRQDDFPANAVLYGKLTPQRYDTWLRRTGVRYVFLPDDPLDYSARNEAALLRSGPRASARGEHRGAGPSSSSRGRPRSRRPPATSR